MKLKQKIALFLAVLLLASSCALSVFAGGYDGEWIEEAAPVMDFAAKGVPVPHAELCEFCRQGDVRFYKTVKNEDWTSLKLCDCTHSVGHKHRIERATITAYYRCDNNSCGAVTSVPNYDFYYRTYCYFQGKYINGALEP